MPIYNLLEYYDNYTMASGSLQNYYRDEVNHDANENNADNTFRVSNEKITASKSFEYKTKIVCRAGADNNRLDTEVASYSIKIFE